MTSTTLYSARMDRGGIIGRVTCLFILSGLIAAVLPSDGAAADSIDTEVVVALALAADCDDSLTRLINLDGCGGVPVDQVDPPTISPSPATLNLNLRFTSPVVDPVDTSNQADISPASTIPNSPEPKPTPCPAYSIASVFDEPTSDWDGDNLSNILELYNDLDPCVADVVAQPSTVADGQLATGATAPVVQAETPLATETDDAVVEDLNPCPAYGIDSVFADPDGDWDADRVSNLVEFDNRLDPCTFDASAASQVADVAPTASASDSGVCPSFSIDDVYADADGDWDGDRASNLNEFFNNSDPCLFDAKATTLIAQSGGDLTTPLADQCLSYGIDEVLADADGDWDGDRISNATEFYNSLNPCDYDILDTFQAAALPAATGVTPCPSYSVTDVYDDPSGDWDLDGQTNIAEFDSTSNPCDFDEPM